MTKPKSKQSGNPLQNVKGAVGGVLTRELIRRGPALGFKLMPKPILDASVKALVTGLVTLFGSEFLRGNDGQATIADLLTILIPDKDARASAALVLTEIIEEAVKTQKDFGDDPDENRERAHEIISGAFERRGMSGDKKAEKSAKPSDKTVLQVVGELDAAQQRDFWVIVDLLQQKLNGNSQHAEPNVDQPGDEITRLINRVKLSKEQVLAILAATPEGLQQDLLLQALRQSTSAGGAGSGLGRLWDRALGVIESAMPTGGTSGNLREEMAAANKRRKKDDDDVSGIR